VAAPNWYDVTPDCIKHDLPAGIPYSSEVTAPFADCTNGFFTFGPGTDYAGATGVPIPEGGSLGDVVQSATFGIWFLTTVGFAVSIAAIVAWVWFEHTKLMKRAEMLRAAARPRAPEAPPPGATG
jgi:hypothetical protein